LSDYRLIIDHVSEQVKCYTVLSLMGLRIAHKAFGRPLDKLQSKWAFLLSLGLANIGIAPPPERGIASSFHITFSLSSERTEKCLDSLQAGTGEFGREVS
jgi:hypothetical protein